MRWTAFFLVSALGVTIASIPTPARAQQASPGEATATAPVKIATSDGKGVIYVDGKVVAEGSYAADLPAGRHTVRITREGFDPFEEEVVVVAGQPMSRTVTLSLVSDIDTVAIAPTERRLEGVYGGFQVFAAALLGGSRSSPQKLCDEGGRPVEIASCSGGTNLGGGLGAYIGYHWNPIGVELFALGQYDTQSPSFRWNASSVDAGIGPDPARTEDFQVQRAGGVVAARIRFTHQRDALRFSVAGGVGVAARNAYLTRDARSVAEPSLRDRLVTDGVGYTSLALSLEPSLQLRLTDTAAFVVGASLLVDNPTSLGDVPRSEPEGGHRLGPSGLTTPGYDLASGTQTWLGLFAGLMFGP